MQDSDPTNGIDVELFGLTRRRLVKSTGVVAAAGAFGLTPGLAAAQEFEDLCEAVPNDVMLVLDRSTSMVFEPNKFQNAKDGAKDFVDALTPSDFAGLVSFGSSPTLDRPLTDNFASVKAGIDSLIASGSTNITDALTLARNHLLGAGRPDANPIMVLLSDGVPNSPPTAINAADSVKAAGIRLITIAYGDDADPALLAQLASDPDANNAFDASIDDIADIFATIAQEICPTEITCDIKPGGDQNTVNPRSKGVIPVAILSEGGFDATTIDPSSLRFGAPSVIVGGGGATVEHGDGHSVDIDADGDLDLLCHFSTEDAGFSDGDTEGWLVGETTAGERVACSDHVRIVGGGGP